MKDVEEVLVALKQLSFRSKFRLGIKEARYVDEKGLPVILEHAKKN